MSIIETHEERKNRIYTLFEEIVDNTIDINSLFKNDNLNEFEECRNMFLIKKRYIKICENVIEILQILTEIKYTIMRKLRDSKIQKTELPKIIIEPPLIEQTGTLSISTYILKKVIAKLRRYRLVDLVRDNSVYFYKIEEVKSPQEKLFIKHLVINNNSESFTTLLLFFKNLNTLKIVNSSFVDFRYFKNSTVKKLILENIKCFKYEIDNEIKEIEFVGFINKEVLTELISTHFGKIKIIKLNNTTTKLRCLGKDIYLYNFISFYNNTTEEDVHSFLEDNLGVKFFHFLEKNFELFFVHKYELEFIFYVNAFSIDFIPEETEFLILQNMDISHLLDNFSTIKQLRKVIIKNCTFSFNDFLEYLHGKEIIHLSLENIKLSFSSINRLIHNLKDNLRSLEILKCPLPNDFIDLITNNLKNCKVVYGDGQEIFIA